MKILIEAYLDNNIGDDSMIALSVKRFPNYQFYIINDNDLLANTFKSKDNLTVVRSIKKESLYNEIDAIVKIGGSIFIINSTKDILLRLLKIYRNNKITRGKK